MYIEFYKPGGIVQDFVDAIIFMKGDGTGIAFPRMHQTIIINMGSGFGVSEIYAPASKERETSGTIWINGKQDTHFMLRNDGRMEMYVIGVRPGRLPYLTGLPAIETTDRAVEAANWGSADLFALRDRLFECPSARAGCVLIEQYLDRLLKRVEWAHLDKIQWLDRAIPVTRVEDICRTLGVTRKRLRYEAQHYFGGSVKNLQGILRLNNNLAAIALQADRPLSALHDHYDQAHFINDFKDRTGITPLQYRKLCRAYPEIRVTPNFIPLQQETFLQFISGGEV